MALCPFEKRVYEYCVGKGLLDGVKALVIGLSGGPDSVALIRTLAAFKTEDPDFPALFAVHVNHGLRDTAFEDEKFCGNLCRELKIPLKVLRYDIKALSSESRKGIEHTGREVRYKSFREYGEQTAESLKIDPEEVRIATAHHKGDLTETFMMNLFRGSGLLGLTAMSADNGIIRPLLEASKGDILDYLHERSAAFVIDETNLSNDYTRNKWRNVILPLISTVSVKTPEDAISDTYELLKADSDFIEGYALDLYEECRVKLNGYSFLDKDKLIKLHAALRTRLLRLLWQDQFHNLIDIESKHVKIAEKMILSLSGTHYADMPLKRRLLATDRFIGFCDGKDIKGLSCAMSTAAGFPASKADISFKINKSELDKEGKTLNLPDSDIYIVASLIENNDLIVYNDYSWISGSDSLTVGLCPPDGIFRQAGSPHERRVSKLTADMKVPRDARSNLIAVMSGSRILWIPGIGHSEGFVDQKSRDRWLNSSAGSEDSSLIRLDIRRKED